VSTDAGAQGVAGGHSGGAFAGRGVLARDVDELLGACGWWDAGVTRVLLLGWAPLHEGARVGSGLNLVAGALATRLRERGFRVASIASGLRYSLVRRSGLVADCAWRGCACIDYVNSPNLATGNYNFRNVDAQRASPQQAAVLVRFAHAARVDVVHVHSFEGYGFDVGPALRNAGVPLVVTPHNYYAVCPQIDLNAREREVCGDYEGGLRCVGCIAAPEPSREARYRARVQTVDRACGVGAYQAARVHGGACVRTVGRAVGRVLGRVRGGGDDRAHAGEIAAAMGWQSGLPPHVKEAGAHDAAREVAVRSAENAAAVHLRVLNEYGSRRVAGVAAMNAAEAVLCPSSCVMDVHRAMGVEAGRLVHVGLGLPHLDELRARALAEPYGDAPSWRSGDARPLRLAFLGTVHPNKGLATVLRAVLGLTREERARVHVLVHASGGDEPYRAWMREVPEVAFLGGYTLERLRSLWREYDVGLFPNAGLDNSPLVVLEHLNAGKPVLASDLGGVRDLVRHGRNGWLAAASDAGAWRDALRQLLSGEWALPAAAEVVAASPLRGFDAFAHDVEVYVRRAVEAGRGVGRRGEETRGEGGRGA
jgi:glycosyltransferase involved in cell wall biosynthesis